MFNWLKSKSEIKKPKTLGQLGEEFAQKEYEKRGFKIIASNFFNKKGLRKGEIDFIAVKDAQITFVEVKARQILSGKFGTGAEAVNNFKQLKLLKAVKIFLLQHREYKDFKPQIDVCLVRYNELDKQPFSAIIISNAVEDWN